MTTDFKHSSTLQSINPFYESRQRAANTVAITSKQPEYAKLPLAPVSASPVPHLTSLYHFDTAGNYGDRRYPGNCGGNIIHDLLRFFTPQNVFDPMTGSGTCAMSAVI